MTARPSIKADGSHIRKLRVKTKKKARVLHEKPQLAKHVLKK